MLGRIDTELSRTQWRGRTESLWPRVEEAFNCLDDRFDLVIAEGAGGPAEINLWDVDVTNMRVVELLGADRACRRGAA